MTPASAAGRSAVLSAVFVIGAGAFGSLGMWQLDRAEQSRAVVAAYRAAGDAEPLSAAAAAAVAAADLESLRFRRLELEGRYQSGAHILLDNITLDGRAGYHVLTPFLPAGRGRRVLVNRGWIEADSDRGVVPALEAHARQRRVAGRVDRMPSAALSLEADPEMLREGVYRVSFPTIDELERLLGDELLPFQLLLDAAEADGFERRWAPTADRAARNTVYAGQWFMMAVGAAGAAVWTAVRAYRAMKEHP